MKKKWPVIFFFRRFWVKESRHSENIFAKKRYTSMVAYVEELAQYQHHHPMLHDFEGVRLRNPTKLLCLSPKNKKLCSR